MNIWEIELRLLIICQLEYLLEVEGYCPKCGKYLLRPKGNSMHKEYEIAHIYPNSPT